MKIENNMMKPTIWESDNKHRNFTSAEIFAIRDALKDSIAQMQKQYALAEQLNNTSCMESSMFRIQQAQSALSIFENNKVIYTNK